MRKEGCGREGRGRTCEGIEERSPINCSKFSTVGITRAFRVWRNFRENMLTNIIAATLCDWLCFASVYISTCSELST